MSSLIQSAGFHQKNYTYAESTADPTHKLLQAGQQGHLRASKFDERLICQWCAKFCDQYHIATCPKRLMRCQLCQTLLRAPQYPSHYEECEAYVISETTRRIAIRLEEEAELKRKQAEEEARRKKEDRERRLRQQQMIRSQLGKQVEGELPSSPRDDKPQGQSPDNDSRRQSIRSEAHSGSKINLPSRRPAPKDKVEPEQAPQRSVSPAETPGSERAVKKDNDEDEEVVRITPSASPPEMQPVTTKTNSETPPNSPKKVPPKLPGKSTPQTGAGAAPSKPQIPLKPPSSSGSEAVKVDASPSGANSVPRLKSGGVKPPGKPSKSDRGADPASQRTANETPGDAEDKKGAVKAVEQTNASPTKRCPWCKNEFPVAEEHEKKCLEKLVLCKRCNSKIKMKDRGEHASKCKVL